MKMRGRHAIDGANARFIIGRRVTRGQASRNWSVEYTWRGRQRTQSLNTRAKRIAIQNVHELDRRLGEDHSGKPRTDTTVQDLVDAYMEMLRARGRASTTIRKYDEIAQSLIEWANEQNIDRAINIGEKEFWSFARGLEARGNAENTRYTKLIFVKQVWKHALNVKLIPANDLAPIHLDKPIPGAQPCFTPDQIVTLLESSDAHHRAVFAFMAYAGLRFGEVRDLQWSDLRLDQGNCGVIELRRGGSGGKTKSRRVRRIHIHPRLRPIIDSLPREAGQDRVFTAPPSRKYPDGGQPLKERELLNYLKRLCKRCEFANHKQYKLHTFRHAFASMCARNNVSYKYALEWMGHTSSAILDLYYTLFDADAEAAIATIDYHAAAA